MSAKLHYNLKQTSNKERLTQIMLATTVNKQRIRVYIKMRVEPKYWDKSRQRCSTDQPMTLLTRNRLKQVNRQLNKLETSVMQVSHQLAEQGKYLSHSAILGVVEEKKMASSKPSNPIAYLYQQVDDYLLNMNRRGKRGISTTQRTYLTALKRLEAFCTKEKLHLKSFDDFDKKFFTNFSNYLYSCTYKRGGEQKLYTQNTVVNTLKVIKNLLHRAYDNEQTDNNYFLKVQTILSSDVSEQVYLKEDEISKLANMKLTLPHEKHIRDMFVVASYTGLRISDVRQLNEATISNGMLSLYQTKTKERVEIPILKEIAELISHYQKTGFPTINICKANETIKDLARRCGISESISYKELRGGTAIIKTKPKWEMISFHTARRSCITNLYRRGYPPNFIMIISGHRSLQAFQRYMRASSKDLMNSFVDLLKKDKAL